jgi:hypothetical protein
MKKHKRKTTQLRIDLINDTIATDILDREDKESFDDLNSLEILEINIRSIKDMLEEATQDICVLNNEEIERMIKYLDEAIEYL